MIALDSLQVIVGNKMSEEKIKKQVLVKRFAIGTPDKPEFGDIRSGKDIGRGYHSYIWNKCIGCGKGEWKVILKGEPVNVNCLSCSAIIRYKNPEAREKTRLSQIKRYENQDERKATGEAIKKSYTPELKALRREIFKKVRDDNPMIVVKSSERLKELWCDLEYRKNMSTMSKNIWQDPIKKDELMKIMIEGRKIKPNKPEKIVLDILDKVYPNEWKYVGDGDLIIGGYNPDFVNINGQKKIIEVFGDYWHKIREDIGWSRTELGRIMCFKAFGYETLIIWESDIKKWSVNKLTETIKEFALMKVHSKRKAIK